MTESDDVRERVARAGLVAVKAHYAAITGVDDLTDGGGFVPVATDAALSALRPGDKLPGTAETGPLIAVPASVLRDLISSIHELRPGQFWAAYSADGFTDLRTAAKEA